MNNLAQTAELLANARLSCSRLDKLPDDARPASVADIYVLQDKIMEKLGPRGGYKAGPAVAQMKPVEGMICAPLPKKTILPSGAAMQVPAGGFVGVEVEIAFRLKRDLPAGAQYTEAQVVEAIEAAVPVIEMVWTRFNDMQGAGALWILGDMHMHGALIVGEPLKNWSADAIDALDVRVTSNGEEIFNKAKAPHPAGHTLQPLVWLANHGGRNNAGLKAGEIITTGSFCGAVPVKTPTDIVAVFPGLSDEVKVTLQPTA